jgi:protein-tyrosine phosphatase
VTDDQLSSPGGHLLDDGRFDHARTVNSVTTSTPTRQVELDSVFNFRDLGGYRTADGRTTRWRVLFRADGLDKLTDDDLDVLRPMALRTVVDLRTRHELDTRGRFPVESHPVTFHHLSILDRTWSHDEARNDGLPPDQFLHRAYHAMLAEGADRFAEAFSILTGPDALPAVFHCAAGKDRTGLLAALVLGALGVERAAIVDDYALTAQTMDRFLASARLDPERSSMIDRTPAAFFAADPAAMRRVLDDLDERHGSVRDYVRSIGVTDGTLAQLDALLLTPC